MDRDCLWEEGTEEMREWRKKEKEEGNQEKERGMRRDIKKQEQGFLMLGKWARL